MAALHLEMLRVATEDLNSKDAQLELLIATATLNERDLRAAQQENAELLAENERLKSDLAAANHVADQALVQLETRQGLGAGGSPGSTSGTGTEAGADTASDVATPAGGAGKSSLFIRSHEYTSDSCEESAPLFVPATNDSVSSSALPDILFSNRIVNN